MRDVEEVGCTNEIVKAKVTEEHGDINHAEWRLIGFKKTGKKMIGPE